MSTDKLTAPEAVAGDIRAAIRRLCALYPDLVNAATPARPPLAKLNSAQIGQLEVYLETLLFWRKRMSLMTTSDPLSIIEHHILDSLFIVPLLCPGNRVADLGSGAGFPGIPLAIACPKAQFTLVESRRKRANFLREAIRSGAIENAFVIEGRAENLTRDEAGTFDVTVTRAVWTTDGFLRVSAPLLNDRGKALAMKGPQRGADLEDAHGLKLESTFDYSVPGKLGRSVLVYTKISA